MRDSTIHTLACILLGEECEITFKYTPGAPYKAQSMSGPAEPEEPPDIDFEGLRILTPKPPWHDDQRPSPIAVWREAVAYLSSQDGWESAVEHAREDNGR